MQQRREGGRTQEVAVGTRRGGKVVGTGDRGWRKGKGRAQRRMMGWGGGDGNKMNIESLVG